MKQTERLNNQCMTRLRNDDGWPKIRYPKNASFKRSQHAF